MTGWILIITVGALVAAGLTAPLVPPLVEFWRRATRSSDSAGWADAAPSRRATPEERARVGQ
jgi:hypothetical protein